MCDEYFNLPPSVVSLVPAVVSLEPTDPTGIPSSTSIDQDASFPSTSQTPQESKSLVIPSGVEEEVHDIKVTHLDKDPFFVIQTILKISKMDQGSIRCIMSFSILLGPVSTRHQLQTEAMFCYFDAFLTSVEPKNYNEALKESCWIEAISESFNGLVATMIFIAYAAHKNMTVYQMDVKNAFLNGILREEGERKGKSVDLYTLSGLIGSISIMAAQALGRERLEFLINKLGMRSMSLETLKGLVEEEEE
ncbi:hypothetical protein Tco_0631780 [Tanacetum coccineum]